jgi:hypothetical protein
MKKSLNQVKRKLSILTQLLMNISKMRKVSKIMFPSYLKPKTMKI